MTKTPEKQSVAKTAGSRTRTVSKTASGSRIVETVENKASENSKKALAIPAIYAPTTSLMRGESAVRLAFGESVSGQTQFHTAVVLPDAAARRLAENILKMLDRVEKAKSSDV